jgi:pimeloyl-ACP methyl ester carboxylesterase
MTVDATSARKTISAAVSVDRLAASVPGQNRRIFWAHGWGQNRRAMAALAHTFQPFGDQILMDFPGFGDAPPPPGPWGTAEYADWAADVIRAEPAGPQNIWVGHSFGCRVGLQLAARHPDLLDRMCLIAGAGLKRRRSPIEQARVTCRIYTYKALKRLAPLVGMDTDRLRERFGSADYRNAGAMREILVKVVGEDLSDVARQVTCPVQLIYGDKDTETPPEIGKRLEQLVPDARLTILPDQDHYSLLADGRHQVARRLRDFLGEAS